MLENNTSTLLGRFLPVTTNMFLLCWNGNGCISFGGQNRTSVIFRVCAAVWSHQNENQREPLFAPRLTAPDWRVCTSPRLVFVAIKVRRSDSGQPWHQPVDCSIRGAPVDQCQVRVKRLFLLSLSLMWVVVLLKLLWSLLLVARVLSTSPFWKDPESVSCVPLPCVSPFGFRGVNKPSVSKRHTHTHTHVRLESVRVWYAATRLTYIVLWSSG